MKIGSNLVLHKKDFFLSTKCYHTDGQYYRSIVLYLWSPVLNMRLLDITGYYALCLT